jgi:hypothetical protein
MMPLKSDITDVHFSQLFFVIGHIAIKMLTYVEVLETELKQALANSFKKKKDSDENENKNDEEESGKK